MAGPDENLRSQQVDIAVANYLEAHERGCPPDREAFLAEHPDIADALREFLDDYQLANRVIPRHHADTSAGAARSTGGSRLIAPTLPLPCAFGAFELLEEVARGGMGVVYKARQKNPERIVALKMILAGQLASQTEVERFTAEAHAAAVSGRSTSMSLCQLSQARRTLGATGRLLNFSWRPSVLGDPFATTA